VNLLDTHILLSALGQADLGLPPTIHQELSSGNKAHVSVVSIWEIAIKNRIGKMRLTFDIQNLPTLIRKQEIAIIEIKSEHTLAEIGPELITKDPFDRLLLGVCAAEGMRLLTLDHAMVGHPLVWR
jgi:PIN domain nuclease of toxin-antitoxin system